MKKILVVSYSQTGQLASLVENFTKPLANDEDFELVFKNIEPKVKYPFPWNVLNFMEIFPEAAHLEPCELKDIEDDENDYDLIILAYSVWFLSPSIPISSFLQTSYARKKFKNNCPDFCYNSLLYQLFKPLLARLGRRLKRTFQFRLLAKRDRCKCFAWRHCFCR